MLTKPTSETAARLRDFAETYRVYYLVRPELLMVGTELRRVGFDISLFGTEDHVESHVVAGCPNCRRTYDAMSEIAEWMLPEEHRASRYEIEPFDRSVYIVASQPGRRNVAVDVRILHRHGFDEPIDACEERCYHEMLEKLATLGIRESRWYDAHKHEAE